MKLTMVGATAKAEFEEIEIIGKLDYGVCNEEDRLRLGKALFR